MLVTPDHTRQLLDLVKSYYPNWTGFGDPRFVEDEVTYKHETVRKAKDLLGRSEFDRLIDANEHDELITRLELVAKGSNLLWLQVPRQGDLAVLYHPDLDKPTFARAMCDLLYGSDATPDRLDRFATYCQAQGLPNKWTLPTYLLFMLYPDTEMFVKPQATRWLFEFVGRKDRWTTKPNGSTYASLREIIVELRTQLAEYRPHDNIDIQGLLWACYSIQKRANVGETTVEDNAGKDDHRELAEPFSRIFADWGEAEWAFGLMRESLLRLGVQSPDDQRVAIILHGPNAIRLRMGYPAFLVFFCDTKGPQVQLELLQEGAQNYRASSRELRAPNSIPGLPPISAYVFPIDMVRVEEPSILDLYWQTLNVLKPKLAQRPDRDSFRRYHDARIAQALWGDDELSQLLTTGLNAIQVPNGYFGIETFRLLYDLHDNPTRDFYQNNREAFAEHLEQPFRQLFADVVARLPEPITTLVETDKGVHARILKNDYGRGLAWSHLWSAMYPKGGKRIRDAQLFIWVNKDEVRYGFYIGEHGDDSRRRFRSNAQMHSDALLPILAPVLREHAVAYGTPDDSIDSLEAWLRSEDDSPRAFVRLSTDEVLAMTKEELADAIAEAFTALFPLMLVAMTNNPMPAIYRYLGEEPEEAEPNPEYPLQDCAESTGIPVETLQEWLKGLERKKQAIFYGPPGTGKTFLAQQLARHLVGGSDGFIRTVQFHPAYAYEDFMLGIRPRQRGESLHYPVVPGHFVEFCHEAAERKSTCVLIIDEINRAELARVFGELMYLLEYRNETVQLAVDRREFSIPENVRIIGTMNTADRSIALVDHALRRRFAFIALYPKYEILEQYHERRGTGFDARGLIGVLRKLNGEIGDENYQVGISFFLRQDLSDHIASIWQMEIEPYLEEYFFDQPNRLAAYRWQTIRNQVLGALT